MLPETLLMTLQCCLEADYVQHDAIFRRVTWYQVLNRMRDRFSDTALTTTRGQCMHGLILSVAMSAIQNTRNTIILYRPVAAIVLSRTDLHDIRWIGTCCSYSCSSAAVASAWIPPACAAEPGAALVFPGNEQTNSAPGGALASASPC